MTTTSNTLYHLAELKEKLGPINSGDRRETQHGIVQHFGWSCGCMGKRPLGDYPLQMEFCRGHRDLQLRRAR